MLTTHLILVPGCERVGAVPRPAVRARIDMSWCDLCLFKIYIFKQYLIQKGKNNPTCTRIYSLVCVTTVNTISHTKLCRIKRQTEQNMKEEGYSLLFYINGSFADRCW
jgi:hypothetical protein